MKQKTFKLSGVVLVCINVMVVESLSQIIVCRPTLRRVETGNKLLLAYFTDNKHKLRVLIVVKFNT